MVSNEEIRRRLEAKRRGIEYREPAGRKSINFNECSSCHTENPASAKFCVGCGKKLESSQSEKGFSPNIKGPESGMEEEKTGIPEPSGDNKGFKTSSRPDDFGRTGKQQVTSTAAPRPSQIKTPAMATKKLEPIVPPSSQPESKKIEPVISKTPEPSMVKTTEGEPESTTEAKANHSDVDPVERIKKAKELLDIGAITQEEFEMIKNKYLDEI
jgi:hypothetical protein